MGSTPPPSSRWGSVLCLAALLLFSGCAANTVRYKIDHRYAVGDDQFVRTMDVLLGPALVRGNKVTTLRNGRESFPAMLAAIRSAKRTVDFETFVYWRGDIGQAFADALAERARAGVAVHVIIDWVGADKIDQGYIDEMRKAGAQVVRYHALHWYNVGSAAKLNHRTHRKLLIVDGTTGFTGGIGIADEWGGDARNPDEWRDNHYKVDGPVVAELQAAFLDNWMKTTGEVLHGEPYFPPLAPAGDMTGQVFKSSAEGGAASMQLLYLLSVTAARDHVRLASAYFVPDQQTTDALIAARQRGVTVEILVPGKHIDVEIVRGASRARWGPLLRAGIEIYEYDQTMFHVKQAIFDDQWVSIGSSNLDARSFKMNDEANLNVLDRAFARQQIAVFEADKAKAHRITYQAWRDRPWTEKFAEDMASILGPLL
jgi:cardiolipin synthase